MINFEATLEPHIKAVELRARRAEVLAGNLANADTPSFRARDFDFRDALRDAVGDAEQRMYPPSHAMHPSHLGVTTTATSALAYRIPTQPAIDGNTVEETVEKTQFTQNALQYHVSLRFLNGKIKSLMSAIRGE